MKTIERSEHILPLPEELARAYPLPSPTPTPIDEVSGNGFQPEAVEEQPDLPHYTDPPTETSVPEPETSFADDFATALQYVRGLRFAHYGSTEELTPALLIMLLAEMREQRFLLASMLKQEQETP